MGSFTWNRKRIESDAEEAKSRGQGLIYINLKDGERFVGRPLPVEVPKKGQEAELYVRYGQHYLKDMELYVTCVDELIVADFVPKDWSCSFCEMWKKLRASGDADDQEEARKYNVSIRYVSNFKIHDGGVKLFRYSSKTQPRLVALAFGSQYTDILDLKDGRDIEIKRLGSSLDTDYQITPMKDVYTLPASVLGELHDIYSEIKVLDPKYQRVILKGGEPADDEYVTLRELMTIAGVEEPAARVEAPVTKSDGGGSVIAKRRRSVASAEDDGSDAPPNAALGKTLSAFADELGVELDLAHPRVAIENALATEAVDVLTRKLSEPFKTWLDERGYDVSGKLVAVVKEAEVEVPPADTAMSEVEKQIAAVRARRGKKK